MKTKNQSITISFPTITVPNPTTTIQNIWRTTSTAFIAFVDRVASRAQEAAAQARTTTTNTPQKSRRSAKRYLHKKHMPKYLLGVFALIAVLMVFSAVRNANSTSERIEVQEAYATTDIAQAFEFPVLDDDGTEITRLTYEVQDAELRNEIIVKGQRARAIEGRTFLVFTVKIANPYDKALEINARNYVRISVNGKEDELLAPEIHNDPVTVQAISTKFTRLGIPLNDTDENIVLHVGEVTGDKERVELAFNN